MRTRFDRVTATKRKRFTPPTWLEQARSWGAFPFYELQAVVKPQSELSEEEERSELPKVNRHEVSRTTHTILDNAMHQAYLSGVEDTLRSLEALPLILRAHSKSPKMFEEVEFLFEQLRNKLSAGGHRF